jgi:hypothetical protein
VINSRYVLHEAQQAHHFGLDPHLALASVTSTPATAAGMAHRLGLLREGADADVVLWDAHPLQIGALPRGVWVDGVRVVPAHEEDGGVGWENDWVGGDEKEGEEDEERQQVPDAPDYEKEREEAVRWEGLQPLTSKREEGKVVFRNVRDVWMRDAAGVRVTEVGVGGSVVVQNGSVVCRGECAQLAGDAASAVDLRGGSIAPAMMSFGECRPFRIRKRGLHACCV